MAPWGSIRRDLPSFVYALRMSGTEEAETGVTDVADASAPLVPTFVPTGAPARATTVKLAARVAVLEPLSLNDPRYAELTEGERSRQLARMRLRLEQSVEDESHLGLKMALVGHRGAGKSTELFRLENQLLPLYFPVHVFLDESLKGDCDYSLLILQMCEQLCRTFADRDLPLDEGIVEDVGRWFATRTEVEIDKDEQEIRGRVDARAHVGGTLGLFGARLMGLVRMQAIGNTQRRVEIASKLRNRPDELIAKANLLLSEARRVLAAHGRPDRLLIVHDNYDRLERDAAHELFFKTGDLLRQIEAACIFTIPVTARLAPYHAQFAFKDCYILHTVKLKLRDGSPNPDGVTALRALLSARVDLDNVFADEATVERLILASGGSLRDIVRLLGKAGENALLDGKARIDLPAVEEAIREIRNAYAQSFFQENKYYRRLAHIHLTKRDTYSTTDSVSRKETEDERLFFEDLLTIGAVLEYNGDGPWYDVHPTILEIPSFQTAFAKARDDQQPGTGTPAT